jgi:2,3-bisphosphoglycerate-independent phosphoglycerate mutase
MQEEVIQKLLQPADTRIVLLVIDGLGGMPRDPGGHSELETARTPNLDELARRGICGLHEPVGAGITPGSGPAHLGVFGYDPVRYQVGRGALAACGIGFDLQPGDVAARGNFCTIDDRGRVTDRRAGRIPTEKAAQLCQILQKIDVAGIQVFALPVKEYRMLLVLRGKDLSDEIDDTDPQGTGVEPLSPRPRSQSDKARGTADLIGQVLAQARDLLADQHPANMLLLRGFARRPDWPSFFERFGVRAAAIASYPMYRGLAGLLRMQILETGPEFTDEFATLERNFQSYDFFYLHMKTTDSAGEDGDFDRKVALIEKVDQLVPRLTALKPDVIVVTGDHSTPARMKLHTWHPVPTLLCAGTCRPDPVTEFGEAACLGGALGPRFPAVKLMPLALAHAGRLAKFGA